MVLVPKCSFDEANLGQRCEAVHAQMEKQFPPHTKHTSNTHAFEIEIT